MQHIPNFTRCWSRWRCLVWNDIAQTTPIALTSVFEGMNVIWGPFWFIDRRWQTITGQWRRAINYTDNLIVLRIIREKIKMVGLRVLYKRGTAWSESLRVSPGAFNTLEIADECEASNVFISFVILSALNKNKQVWVYPELFARLSQILSNGCRMSSFRHCNRWELWYQYLYLVLIQSFHVTLSGLLNAWAKIHWSKLLCSCQWAPSQDRSFCIWTPSARQHKVPGKPWRVPRLQLPCLWRFCNAICGNPC